MLKKAPPLRRVALLGGTGFVGRALAARLQREGLRTRVITRDLSHTRALWTLPDVECRVLDTADAAAFAAALEGCDAVVNLVGILNERGDDGRGFARVHVAFTAQALAAAGNAGVSRYVQMSALNADPAGPSHYLQSKGEAEAKVRATVGMRTAILRPSVIFGDGDGLFGRFAPLVRWLPFLPLAGAHARMQPVFVGDVVEAVWRVLKDDHLASGTVFELGGPTQWTLGDIVSFTARCTRHFCPVIPLPNWLGRLQAEVCEHLPGKPFSRDNWRSLQADSVVRGEDGLAQLGIVPTLLTSIVPALLAPARRAKDHAWHRRHAHR